MLKKREFIGVRSSRSVIKIWILTVEVITLISLKMSVRAKMSQLNRRKSKNPRQKQIKRTRNRLRKLPKDKDQLKLLQNPNKRNPFPNSRPQFSNYNQKAPFLTE